MAHHEVDKEFLGYLEEQMDLKTECTIKFRDVNGAVATIKAHIIDISSVAHRDMIETDAGIHIGVDQLVSVNDRPAAHYC